MNTPLPNPDQTNTESNEGNLVAKIKRLKFETYQQRADESGKLETEVVSSENVVAVEEDIQKLFESNDFSYTAIEIKEAFLFAANSDVYTARILAKGVDINFDLLESGEFDADDLINGVYVPALEESGKETEQGSSPSETSVDPTQPPAPLSKEQESVLRAVNLSTDDFVSGGDFRKALILSLESQVNDFINKHRKSQKDSADTQGEANTKDKTSGAFARAGRWFKNAAVGNPMSNTLEHALEGLGMEPEDVLDTTSLFVVDGLRSRVMKLFPDESLPSAKAYEIDTFGGRSPRNNEDIKNTENLLGTVEPWATEEEISQYEKYTLDNNGKDSFIDWYDKVLEKPEGIFGVFSSSTFRNMMHNLMGTFSKMATWPFVGKMIPDGFKQTNNSQMAVENYRGSEGVENLKEEAENKKIAESWDANKEAMKGMNAKNDLIPDDSEYKLFDETIIVGEKTYPAIDLEACKRKLEKEIVTGITVGSLLTWAEKNMKDGKAIPLTVAGIAFIANANNKVKLVASTGEKVLKVDGKEIKNVAELNELASIKVPTDIEKKTKKLIGKFPEDKWSDRINALSPQSKALLLEWSTKKTTHEKNGKKKPYLDFSSKADGSTPWLNMNGNSLKHDDQGSHFQKLTIEDLTDPFILKHAKLIEEDKPKNTD